MKVKRFVSLLLVVFMILGLTGCGGTQETNTPEQNTQTPQQSTQTPEQSNEPAEKKVLKIGGDYEGLSNLDIYLSTYNYVYELCDVMLDGLIGKDPETMELYPVLVEDMPEISEDGKTFTFKLKEGVKFHDGTELKTSDVVYSFTRFFLPETKCVNTWLADMIKGSKDVMEGKTKTLSGIEVIDDYKFSITLEYAYTPFVAVLAASPLKIYPEKACTELGDRWGIDTIIGTGPYKLETFEPKSKVVVTKFEEYHGESKKLDQIEFLNMDQGTALMEFEAGNIDVVNNVDTQLIETYKSDPDFSDNVHYQNYLGVGFLCFNQAHKPLDDIRVRQAISLATNAEELTEVHFKGAVIPAYTLIPPNVIGHKEDAEPFEYNPEKAKQLLAEAGYADGIEITATETEGDPFVDIYLVLQEQYKKANIKLNIELVDEATFYDKRGSGNFQFYLRSWYCDYVDPDFFLYNLFHSSVATTFSTGFINEDYDRKIEAGRLMTDQAERQKYYEELEYKLTRELVAERPMYFGGGYFLVSDRAENVYVKSDWLLHLVDGNIK